ncbi:MAG: tetratricopeptide repeat protein [Spirochaetales bacterium]|nr:tetratricopeptide repeat protein [Spirochaetales bacterium]
MSWRFILPVLLVLSLCTQQRKGAGPLQSPLLLYLIPSGPENDWQMLEQSLRGFRNLSSFPLADRSLFVVEGVPEARLAQRMGATHIVERKGGTITLQDLRRRTTESLALEENQLSPGAAVARLLADHYVLEGQLAPALAPIAAGGLFFQSYSPAHVPLLMAEGRRALPRRRYHDALAYYARSRDILERNGLVTHDLALSHRGIALASYYLGDPGRALAHFREARRILALGGFTGSFYDQLIALDTAILSRQPAGFDAATFADWPLLQALFYFHEGSLSLASARGKEALASFDASTALLLQRNLMNSDLFLALLFNTGNAALLAGEFFQAMVHYTWAQELVMILGMQNTALEKQIETNSNLLSRHLMDRYRPEARPINLGIAEIRLADPYLTGDLPEAEDFFQTRKEYDRIASYTGAFNFRSHPRMVQARTYQGRHDDTNLFLRDLLGTGPRTPEMQRLSRLFLESHAAPRGEGLLFVEIGPGIAHPQYPAVTTIALAEEFKEMQFVALDLPDQVALFQKNVPPARRSRVLAVPNLSILSGDGTLSLKKQWQEEKNWLVKRPALSLDSKAPLFIRSVNAIDIYSPWKDVEPALRMMAQEFKDRAVILFFNRNICLKLRDQERFYIVGAVSPRGFHHNVNSLARRGEHPYTVSSMVLFLKP